MTALLLKATRQEFSRELSPSVSGTMLDRSQAPLHHRRDLEVQLRQVVGFALFATTQTIGPVIVPLNSPTGKTPEARVRFQSRGSGTQLDSVAATILDKGLDANVKTTYLLTILRNNFPTFLDNGSPLSFLGNEVIDTIREKNIQTKQCYNKINFLRGFYICSEEVTLSIKFGDQSRKQKFYILPGTITTILLERDFLSPAIIGFHVGCGE